MNHQGIADRRPYGEGWILTDRQREVLNFIAECQRRGEGSPTRAEIAHHFGWKSANAAEDHLRALKRKGYIELRPGRARGVVLLPGAVA